MPADRGKDCHILPGLATGWLKTNAIYLAAGYAGFLAGNRIGSLWIRGPEGDVLEKASGVLDSLLPSFLEPTGLLPSWQSVPLLMGMAGCGSILLLLWMKGQKRNNFRVREEHGSARFADLETEARALANDEDPDHSIPYSQHVSVSMDTRKTFLNCNTLTIGGSGSGKTRYHVKPMVLNMACNYVITDPKDMLVKEIGHAFVQAGYDIKYLNLVDFSRSMHYNPFRYIQTPSDIFKFVNNLVAATNKNARNVGEDEFFEKSEIALLTAIIFLMYASTAGTEEDRNILQVMDLLDMAEASEEDENARSPLDFMFSNLRTEMKYMMENGVIDPAEYKNSYAFLALRQYNLYKKAAGKTAKSILISLGVRMAVFNLPELSDLMLYDELDLATIGQPKAVLKTDASGHPILWNGRPVYEGQGGESLIQDGDRYRLAQDGEIQERVPKWKKTVLFVAISDSDSTYNFLASILYQQLFDLLYRQADASREGKLPIHTRFVLDEFANISRITDFEIKIATMRSREISVDVILQNLAQLKNLYKDSWETIEGNCDTTLFLGGKEYSTLERLSKIIGTETVDHISISENRGGTNSGSYTRSNQLISRALLSADEIGRLSSQECLVHIRGKHIFRDRKYDLLKHKNYVHTADYDPANRLDTRRIRELFVDRTALKIPQHPFETEEEDDMIFQDPADDRGLYDALPEETLSELWSS